MIDYQAKKVLETVADDGTEAPHRATRHLREIRAEVELVRRHLRSADSTTRSDSPASSTGETDLEESTIADTDLEDTDTAVPMIVRRGTAVTAVLGPDPVAYERWRLSERDDCNQNTSDDAHDGHRGDGDA